MQCDVVFWERYGIKAPLLLLYKVSPIQNLFLDGNIHYTHHSNNPAYHYSFGKNEDKVYFPKKKSFRFLCNTSVLQGYEQLPKTGEILIITKSLKDVMVLYNLNYPSVAPQSESMSITDKDYEELSQRFDTIYSWYDFDLTGIRTANKMKKKYGIIPLFLTNGRFKSRNFGAKDVSDWFEILLGRERTLSSIKREVRLLRESFSGESSKIFSKQDHSKIIELERNEGADGFSKEKEDNVRDCPF